ncbi:hypothetical protein [Reyranella soli]|uniref:Nitrogen fixation protein n=1 Tax=Reyranella soli TaxID=1230389 RepID=A0A512N6Q4_9HYPH|nr:hypothetical protein [Reyranella soli]GEP54660.1 hypothetical protein RSO01_18260 [Reyranella soli]
MSNQKTCPSTTGDTATAEIIGVIGTDGLVRNIPTPIPLTDEMRESVGPRPERIFRLAGPCMEGRCANWQNKACALIDRMREQAERLQLATDAADKLPRCAIRPTCVWWRQRGPEACQICPQVAYNPS